MLRAAGASRRDGVARVRKELFLSKNCALTLCFIAINETRVEFSGKKNGRELE